MEMKNGMWFLCAGALALADAAVGAEVASSTLRVTFDESRKGEVVAVVAAGRDYASPVVRWPLFEIACCPSGQFTNRVVASSRTAKAFAVETLPDGVRFVYRDVGGALDAVVCTVTARGPDVVWRIAATPKSGWALFKTRYPVFALNECLGSTPVDDCVVMGNAKGGILRNPMRPGRVYWKERRNFHYPGSLVSQFGCYYDDAGGLYTAAYDTEAHTKALLMDRWWRLTRPDGSYRHGDLLLEWSRFGYTESPDAQSYDIVTRGFAGADGAPTTWYDAADIYKAWAHRQKWSRTKFLDRSDLPAWTREAPAVMRFNREWFDRPETLKRWLSDYWTKNFPGVPLIAILEGWERHGDWITTEYFPCYPSDEKFKEMMGWIRAAGGHPWPWPGGHHWNVTVGKKTDGAYRLDFSKDFWSRVAPHAVCDPDGKVHLDDLVWLGGGTSASLCPADPWTIDWWNKDIARALVERGCDLVQADQDVGGRVPSCWSVRHGHPPGPGQWETRAMRHQFETMIAEMRTVNPWALFSFEEPHEYYNDLMSFVDYRNCRDAATEWASVFNYLYHEYVSPFQSGAEMYERPFWLAFCAADGQVPRLPLTRAYYDASVRAKRKDMAAALAFCEAWVRLYHGEGRKYLAHGKMLRPPTFRCETVNYEENFRGREIKNVKPVVFHALWEARDGTRALALANATGREQPVAWKAADGSWRTATVAPRGLLLVPWK